MVSDWAWQTTDGRRQTSDKASLRNERAIAVVRAAMGAFLLPAAPLPGSPRRSRRGVPRLVGRGWGWGWLVRAPCLITATPLPSPPPQGGRETESHASGCTGASATSSKREAATGF